MNRTRVMLVDDDRDHLELMRQALAGSCEAMDVLAVLSREDFVSMVRHERLDCVVLDYDMPPYTALDFLRDLDRLQPEVPRIVISSSDEQRVVIEAVRQGATDFVQKHDAILGTVLADRIQAVIRAARAARVERRSMCRRLRTLERCSQLDVLTGVLNRRGAELALSHDRSHKDRRTRTSIIFVDLDHFKRVNDTLGHLEGDRVLRETAEVLKESACQNGLVARWGGEEFLVVQQSQTLAEAWAFGERLRLAVRDRVRLPGTLSPQTVSVGVDMIPTDQLGVECIQRADRAMYLAKESGRDRVCTWAMARAIDLAHEAGARAEMSVSDRIAWLLQRLWNELGDTQREHTVDHGRRVRELSMDVAQECGPGEPGEPALRLASEFHDIGKVAVPEELLACPRPLTVDERKLVDEHSRIGAEILRACGAGDEVAAIVERHHSRYDDARSAGSEAHPHGAHVVCACDAAITIMSERPYSWVRTPAEMLSELAFERGGQFHPGVVDAIRRLTRQSPDVKPRREAEARLGYAA